MCRRSLILPKAATTNKSSAETQTANGAVSATESRTNPEGFTDFVEVEEAKAEYNKRKKTQLGLIKKTDKALLRAMLYQMVLGRVFEEKSAEVYRMGKIGGFCHLYIGQEAIGVGSIMALDSKDMFGIKEFTAIINPPESGILAIGGAHPTPVVREGQIVVRSLMNVTMSCDHRVVDGATGAKFLQTFKQMLEQPAMMLA